MCTNTKVGLEGYNTYSVIKWVKSLYSVIILNVSLKVDVYNNYIVLLYCM